jgi:hypothetical protein
MTQFSREERAQVVACLVMGDSLRATTRVHRTTVMMLLADLGEARSQYQDITFRKLTRQHIQCDEIWSLVGCKEKNVPAGERKNGSRDLRMRTATARSRVDLGRGDCAFGLMSSAYTCIICIKTVHYGNSQKDHRRD